MANTAPVHHAGDGESRRDFLLHSTIAFGAVGGAMAVWPLIHSMNPAADTLALSTTEFSLAGLQEGQAITVVWRGKPVFVRYRTQAEIDAARATPLNELVDPQTDAVITAFESEKNPYFNMVEHKPDGNIALVCSGAGGGVVARQLAPHVYSMNASIYVWHTHSLSKGLWSSRETPSDSWTARRIHPAVLFKG